MRRGPARDDLVQGGLPCAHGLPGEAIDEVDAEAREDATLLGARQAVQRGLGARTAVASFEPEELRLVERLDAERNPRHTERHDRLEPSIGDLLGVRFERDLGARHEPLPRPQVRHEARQGRQRPETRRPATDIERPIGPRRRGCARGELGDQGRGVTLGRRGARGRQREITVGAAVLAIGVVDVEPAAHRV
jgi:hypothetical protein